MSSIDTLEDLIEQGRIKILPQEVYYEYTKMYLEKFHKNFDITFGGEIDVDLIFSKKGSFVINIVPSNRQSYISFVKNKEDAEEKGIMCSYGDCVQVLLKHASYQVQFSCKD